MNDLPSVSIIVPFYNSEKFIQQAIESVLAQTYSSWELLLVDDGSTDGSTVIARKYAEWYPKKVYYLEHAGHANCGKSVTRNLGIQKAKGKYIALLDSDDVWLPNILEEQVAILEDHSTAGMVYGPIQWWYSWTGNPEDTRRDFTEDLGVPTDTLINPPMLLTYFLQNKAAVPSDILVRREVVDRAGAFEEDFRFMYEDQVFVAKICLKTPVFASSQCWYRYRQHPESSCAVGQLTGEYYSTRQQFLTWLEQYLSEQQTEDPILWKALKEELWPFRHPFLFRIVKIGRKKLNMEDLLIRIGRRTIPLPIRHWLWVLVKGPGYPPAVGSVRLGHLRRLTPFSREFGYDRGRPIDRYYIERFLSDNRKVIRGRVLEIADNNYTRQFGGDRVTKSDVLHVSPDEPNATIIGDLVCADHIPADSFDCIILTQTLQVIYDVRAALKTVYRILKPGGVIMATFPGLSPISRYDMDRWGYYWGFTSLSARRLFEEVFPADCIQIKAYGNVLSATAFLYGMATEELKAEEMEYFDPDYEVIIAARAIKP